MMLRPLERARLLRRQQPMPPISSIPAKVKALLQSKSGSLLLPGPSGTLRYVFQPGNYVESTGQTLTPVDGAVGLVLDAASAVSTVELLTNKTALAHNVSRTVVAPGGATGKAFRITGAPSGLRTYDGVSLLQLATGDNTVYCSGTYLNLFQQTGSSMDISGVSVRAIAGTHAVQATTQNKPLLRNAGGVRSWQFDVTDDRLSLNAVPFQVNDDYWIVSGATCTKATGDASILSLRGSASPTPIAGQIGLNAGRVDAVWRSDAGVLLRITDTVSVLNSPVIASVMKAGSVKTLYRDNVLVGTNTDAVGSTTVNTATVGAAVTTTVQNQFGGDIHAIMFGTGTLTENQLLLLRNFVAQLQDRTL